MLLPLAGGRVATGHNFFHGQSSNLVAAVNVPCGKLMRVVQGGDLFDNEFMGFLRELGVAHLLHRRPNVAPGRRIGHISCHES